MNGMKCPSLQTRPAHLIYLIHTIHPTIQPKGISEEHGVAPDGQLTATERLSNLDVYYTEVTGGACLCVRKMGYLRTLTDRRG